MAFNITRRNLVAAVPVAASAIFAAAPAWADDYPSRTIRLIVPYTTGGLIDLNARILAPHLSELLKQTVIVENKPGAGSIIGTQYVARSAPNGYTLLVGGIGGLVTEAIYSNLPFSFERDLVPISEIILSPNFVFVKGDSPIKSVHDLVAYCKANPNKATYATAAPIFWLLTELFAQKTGLTLTRVPYKGSGGADLAITSGEVLFAINSIAPMVGQVKSGAVRVLATTGSERLPAFPDVPTLAEAGVPGISVIDWTGLWAPAGTPPAIISRLNKVVGQILAMKDVQDHFSKLNLIPHSDSSADFKNTIGEEIKLWKDVARKTGINMKL